MEQNFVACDANENNGDGYRMNNEKIAISKSFEYKTKIAGNTSADNSRLDTKVIFPIKYLSNFWRSLDLFLINCKAELDLSESKNSTISEISRTAAMVEDNPAEATATAGAIFQINNAKLYVPLVNDNIKFLEHLKQRFRRTVSWNKYRSEI